MLSSNPNIHRSSISRTQIVMDLENHRFTHTSKIKISFSDPVFTSLLNDLSSLADRFQSDQLKLTPITKLKVSGDFIELGYEISPKYEERETIFDFLVSPIMDFVIENVENLSDSELDSLWQNLPKYSFPPLVWVYRMSDKEPLLPVDFDCGFMSIIWKVLDLAPDIVVKLWDPYCEEVQTRKRLDLPKRVINLEDWLREYPNLVEERKKQQRKPRNKSPSVFDDPMDISLVGTGVIKRKVDDENKEDSIRSIKFQNDSFAVIKNP